MDYKTGEIVETKNVTFTENVPNLRGIVHSMPGLNGYHWFAPDQLQVPPAEPVPDSTSVSDSIQQALMTTLSSLLKISMIFLMNRYSYNQRDLVHKLASSLIPQRISNHGGAINHDALKSTQFARSTMLLVVMPFPPRTRCCRPRSYHCCLHAY